MKFNFKLFYWSIFLIISLLSSAVNVIAVVESSKLSDDSDLVNEAILRNTNNQNVKKVNDLHESSSVINENLNFDNNIVQRTSCGLNSDSNDDINKINNKNDDNVIVPNEIREFAESNEIKDATQNSIPPQENLESSERLPDIPANPAVITLSEKPTEFQIDPVDDNDIEKLIPTQTNETELELDSDVGDPNIKNDFIIIPEVNPNPSGSSGKTSTDGFEADIQSEKIDDSTGTTVEVQQQQQQQEQQQQQQQPQPPDIEASGNLLNIPSNLNTTENAEISPEVNLTVEEKSIPVFSEWTQKQMEEAEKKLEQEVVNSSSQKKNSTNGTKPSVLKLRTKNYASPDCGAKIIASNADAQNTGALLTSSKDEYMLSPCTNRIWFVVELCEAIQAEKIDLANFELFSSSPKNFTVAVSNRFPTRDWSNVGRFIAADQRNIQGFDLHPHLFGKFVRVDIHSHYNSEHFCPVSLFRVFGTSEFEAFETENRAVDDIDDYDDDILFDQGNIKNENTLFKSASDAVLSIVKKAAEVLVKTNSNKTESDHFNGIVKNDRFDGCETTTTLSREAFTCEKCSSSFVGSVNYLLSCKYQQLVNLLNIELLRNHLITSQICAKRFNINTISFDKINKNHNFSKLTTIRDERQSYILSLMPYNYLASFCHLLANKNYNTITANGYKISSQNDDDSDPALNLTIDNKLIDNNFETLNNERKDSEKLPTFKVDNDFNQKNPEKNRNNDDSKQEEDKSNEINESNGGGIAFENDKQFQDPELSSERNDEQNLNSNSEESLEDINIFNIEEIVETESNVIPTPTYEDSSSNQIQKTEEPPIAESTIVSPLQPKIVEKTEDPIKLKDIEEPTSWDNIDSLFTEQASAEVVSNADSNGMSASQTNQQRIPNGPHSESVFIRLSNRIKALERNMSLSGQYLEELSRRYKRQVEELQNSFAKTLLAIDEQTRRGDEREQFLLEENHRLRRDLSELSLQIHAWIVLIVCIGAVVILQILISWFLVRSIKRRQKRIFDNLDNNKNKSVDNNSKKQQLCRRKSVEEISSQQKSPLKKVRRPSEEAMRINGSYKDLLILEENDNEEVEICNEEELAESRDEFGIIKNPRQRQRKPSVFYSKDDNLPILIKKNSKSWLFRQESTPGNFVSNSDGNNTLNPIQDPDQSILDEEYANFLPGSDLAYNEFMPEGPSGAQIIISNGDSNKFNLDNNSTKTNSSEKARRRLSSPAFLKSPFSKKLSNGSKKSAHEPTSWEWLKSKDSKKQNISTKPSSQNGNNHLNLPQGTVQINGNGSGSFGNTSTNSSISEVLNISSGASSSESSLRISEISANTNDHQQRAGSVISNGNGSSLSSSSRSSKKQRSFKKMLKKVF